MDIEFVKKSAALARAAPREWQEFLTEFSKYTESQKNLLVNATLDTTTLVQGMTRQCCLIEEKLKNAVQLADKFQSKLDHRTQNR